MHDWAQADTVALLDDITAVSTVPVNWAETTMEFDEMRNLKPGQPLPVELMTAAWGAPAANGLRAAWLLEPRRAVCRTARVLKARVLFHNTGTEPVVFSTETWHQYDPHAARDTKGWTIHRLRPGMTRASRQRRPTGSPRASIAKSWVMASPSGGEIRGGIQHRQRRRGHRGEGRRRGDAHAQRRRDPRRLDAAR